MNLYTAVLFVHAVAVLFLTAALTLEAWILLEVSLLEELLQLRSGAAELDRLGERCGFEQMTRDKTFNDIPRMRPEHRCPVIRNAGSCVSHRKKPLQQS